MCTSSRWVITQPGNSVRIDGGQGLRRDFRAIHQKAHLGAPDLYRERVRRPPLIIEIADRVVRGPVDERWRLVAPALLDEELATLPDHEVRIALIRPREIGARRRTDRRRSRVPEGSVCVNDALIV